MGRSAVSRAWRAIATGLQLPYVDAGIQGNGPGFLSIPDDIALSLAYLVVDTPNGTRLLQGQNNGALLGSPALLPVTQYYAVEADTLAAAQSKDYVFPFTAKAWFAYVSGGTTIRALGTVPGQAVRYPVPIGNAILNVICIPTNKVNVTNVGAGATNLYLAAFSD